MTIFKKKKIALPKRVCLRLKEARKEKSVSLRELSKKTKINKEILLALEECRFCDLPEAEVYQKSYVKKYAEALAIDPDPFLQQYICEEVVYKKQKHPQKNIKSKYLKNFPMLLRYLLAGLLFLILFFYLGWQIKRIVEPPNLEVYSPLEGEIIGESEILLQGRTDKEVQVMVNGENIGIDEQGNFKESIDLSAGLNTLMIEAQKKHGKTTEVVRHIILRQEE